MVNRCQCKLSITVFYRSPLTSKEPVDRRVTKTEVLMHTFMWFLWPQMSHDAHKIQLWSETSGDVASRLVVEESLELGEARDWEIMAL